MKWIIMPVLAGPEMTEAAISDCLSQSVECNLLVINQGIDDAFRDRLERIAEGEPQLHIWHHNPPLPSLGASWNRALDFVWASGGTEALVINNDVRLLPDTYAVLATVRQKVDAYFVTAVGVTREQFDDAQATLANNVGRAIIGNLTAPLDRMLGLADNQFEYDKLPHGGPDFSCYLISRECHQLFRFDENFVPAYCEDLDYHRRLMLAGQSRMIFSINLPYLHLAAQTLKQVDPQKRMKIEAQIGGSSRAYYAKKWGGPVNQERFWVPFGGGFAETDNKPPAGFDCGPTTPEIQKWCQAQTSAAPPLDELSRRMLDYEGPRKTPPPFEPTIKPHVMMPHEPDPYPLQPAHIDAKERG